MKIVLCETIPRTNNDSFDKFFICYDCGNGFEISPNLRKRPVLKDLWWMDSWKRYLKDDIHDWLVSYEIEYSLFMDAFDTNSRYERKEWGVNIPKDKAMLFKLTWCGK
jgi:hypothetical protein